jgi:O-antigen/teichoic acid export membrane protein
MDEPSRTPPLAADEPDGTEPPDGTGRRVSPGAAGERRSAALGYLSYGAGSALRFVVQILFSRTLGVTDFGRFVVARTWGETLGSFADRGYGALMLRLLPEEAEQGRGRAYRRLLRRGVTATLIGGAVLAAASLAVALALGADDAALLVGLALVPLFAMMRFLRVVLVAQRRLHTGMLITEVLQPLVLMAIAVAAFAAFRADPVTAIAALGASVALVLAVEIIAIRPALPPPERSAPPEPTAHPSGMLGPMFVIQGTVILYGAADILIADLVIGAAAAGIYAAASRVAALSQNINNMVEGTAAPRLSAAWGRRDHAELQAIIDRSISTALVPTVIVVAGLLAGGWFVLALFGPEFTDGYPVLVLLLVASVVNAATGPSGNVLIQTDAHRDFAIIQGVLVGLHLPLAWVLARAVGVTGPAWSTLAVTTAINVSVVVVARRRHGLDVTPRPRHLRDGTAMIVGIAAGALRRVTAR